ncbi:hypothetical protein ACTFIR_009794 [Dictyostelium discoideum]
MQLHLYFLNGSTIIILYYKDTNYEFLHYVYTVYFSVKIHCRLESEISEKIPYNRLLSIINLVVQFTPYLFEANNFKFLNWVLTKIKNIHYSTKKTPALKLELRMMVSNFMSYIIAYNTGLKVLEYIHQYYDFILKKEPDGGILPSTVLKGLLLQTINLGLIKTSEFLFQFTSISKNEFEIVSNEKSKLYFSNKFNQ